MGLLPKVAAIAAMMLCGVVAQAQDPPSRPIELSATEAFTHEHSKVRLPPVLTGLPRTEASENEPGQLHTSFQYASADRGEQYIVIIYRDVGGGLPLWFDRARRRAERGEIGTATLHWVGEFVPPGRTNASGLLATYALTGGPYRSSGVALVPVGEWLITFWAASRSRSPAELDARIPAALAEIVWPKMEPAPAAVPVAACTSPLAFSGDAKPVPKDRDSFEQSFMGAVFDAKVSPGPAQLRDHLRPEGRQLEGAFRAVRGADDPDVENLYIGTAGPAAAPCPGSRDRHGAPLRNHVPHLGRGQMARRCP